MPEQPKSESTFARWGGAALGVLALPLLAALPGLFDRASAAPCLPAQVSCERPCLVQCEAPAGASWRESGYLVLEGESSEGAAAAIAGVEALELEPGAPVDMREAGFDGAVGTVPLYLAGRWSGVRLALHSRLSPGARVLLALRQLSAPIAAGPASNNATPARFVLGVSITALLGLLAALAVLTLRRPKQLAAALIALFALAESGPFASLFARAAAAPQRSALRGSLRDEEASRFGAPFAELAALLRARVPAHASVFFPRDRDHALAGDLNWLRYHFVEDFEPYPLPDSRYVFWYRPLELSWDEARGVLLDEHGQQVARVRTLLRLEHDRALLEVLRAP